MEGKMKTDQQSLVKQLQQLACDGDKVVALSKHKGLFITDHCSNDIIIISQY